MRGFLTALLPDGLNPCSGAAPFLYPDFGVCERVERRWLSPEG
jgi:hypothetical protein